MTDAERERARAFGEWLRLELDRRGWSMRYASLTLTVDLYGHVTGDLQRMAGDVLNGIAGGRTGNVLEV